MTDATSEPDEAGEADAPRQESDGVSAERSEAEAGQEPETDGGERPQAHTVRLELADEPGQLLAALKPIADNGGNLLSIFHERGNITPRGRIPVEVDLECPPDRFEGIVDALRGEGINVIQAGAERYGEELSILLVGHLVDTDLSDTLHRIEESTAASLSDLSLSAPEGTDEPSSARLRLATRPGQTEAALESVREIAAEKELNVIEPLTEGAK
ncbi:amino acid-binding protein [Salinigranum halophilum]|uniref:amino acid-binding protein n=1 Tax=Salinigranum halophilum TaxID=2565931 RepID=UPI001F2DF80A|nr:amino acid-binding protein [Salinigranum halophilum]